MTMLQSVKVVLLHSTAINFLNCKKKMMQVRMSHKIMKARENIIVGSNNSTILSILNKNDIQMIS